jgi:hypothetical protein
MSESRRTPSGNPSDRWCAGSAALRGIGEHPAERRHDVPRRARCHATAAPSAPARTTATSTTTGGPGRAAGGESASAGGQGMRILHRSRLKHPARGGLLRRRGAGSLGRSGWADKSRPIPTAAVKKCPRRTFVSSSVRSFQAVNGARHSPREALENRLLRYVPSDRGRLRPPPSRAAERPGSTTPQQTPRASGCGCYCRERWRLPCVDRGTHARTRPPAVGRAPRARPRCTRPGTPGATTSTCAAPALPSVRPDAPTIPRTTPEPRARTVVDGAVARRRTP